MNKLVLILVTLVLNSTISTQQYYIDYVQSVKDRTYKDQLFKIRTKQPPNLKYVVFSTTLETDADKAFVASVVQNKDGFVYQFTYRKDDGTAEYDVVQPLPDDINFGVEKSTP